MCARIRSIISLLVISALGFSPTPAGAEHYAVIFAGGVQQDENHQRYYDSVSRIHDAFMRHLNVLGDHIYVLAADGTDPAADIDGGGSSDWSFVTSAGSSIEAATHDNMQNRLADLATILQPQDTLIVWTYDHGGGIKGDPSVTGEESLSCWHVPGQSDSIRDDELAAWLAPMPAERQAYFFGQCYSGGMLDDLVSAGIVVDDGPLGNETFGCASATHYEISGWSFDDDPHHYIDAIQEAIRGHGKTTTYEIEQWAYDHTWNKLGRGPGGTWVDGKQHPWFEGEDFELAVAHWYGNNSGDWTDSSDWKAGKLPEVAGRPVRIAGPHICNVNGGTHTADIPLMTIRDGGTLDIEADAVMEVYQMDQQGQLRVHDGHFEVTTLLRGTDSGEIQVFPDGSFNASWGRDYGGAVLAAGGDFGVRVDYTGGGSPITVHSAGSFSVGQDLLLGADTDIEVDQTGSTADIARDMTLSGSVTVRNGGQLTVGDECTLGVDQPTDVAVNYGTFDVTNRFELKAGTIDIQGDPAASQLTAGSIRVGETGNVTITINGGRIAASSMQLATEAGYDCNITMDESGWLQPEIVSESGAGWIEFGSAGNVHVVQNAGLVGNAEMASNHPAFSLAGGRWSVSTYELNGGGVYVDNMTVGGIGQGTFTQNDGTVEVFGNLKLAGNPDGTGVYNLRGGNLIAHGFELGSPGAGTINIDGGTLMLPGGTVDVQNLNVGSAAGHSGEFYLGPRTLNCENLRVGVEAGGVLTAQLSHIFASGEIQVGYDHMSARIDQQGGEIHAPLITIGVRDDGWGTWNMDGGTMDTDTLTVGRVGWGQLNQDGGATVEADAVDVGYASDTGNNIYTLDDGTLTVAGELRMGIASGSSGKFRLRGIDDTDLVTAADTYLGNVGYGVFELSGGRHEASGELRVGNGGEGLYSQTGGTLQTGTTSVPEFGSGTFDHTAGTHNTTTLKVGEHGTGEYNLGGIGQVTCRTLFVGHYDRGTFNQTGGNLHVTGDYFVGHSSASLSAANQTAGTSTVDGNLIVGFGDDGPGTFQLGGDSATGIRQDVAGNVTLGYHAGSNGTYTISGRGIYQAELHVGGDVEVGRDGTGTLAMAGGRLAGESGSRVDVSTGSTLRGDGELSLPVTSNGTIRADGAYPLSFRDTLASHGELRVEAPSEFVRGRVEFWDTATLNGPVVNDGYLQVFGDANVNLNGGMSGAGEVTTGSGGFFVNSTMAAQKIEAFGTFHAADDVDADRMIVRGTSLHTAGRSEFDSLAVSMGRYELTGSGAELVVGVAGASVAGDFVQTAGQHSATSIQLGGMAWYMEQPGRYQISGGRLEVGTLRLGAEVGEVLDPDSWMPNMNPIAGTLAITDAAAEVFVTERLVIASEGAVEAVEGAIIHMTGSAFENNATDPTTCLGLDELTLIFEGGEGVVDDFEVAGVDFGPYPDGLVGNFALDTLCLGGDRIGQIRLVDLCDNLGDGPENEVLYVDNLILGPGSSLDLNGHNLYYASGSIDSTANITLGGGTLTVLVPEPSTFLLIVLGLLASAIAGRRLRV